MTDILKAPLTPPEPVKTEGVRYTNNPKVQLIMLLALIFIIIGFLIFLLSSGLLGIILVVIGAALIVVDVFVRIK